LVTEAWAKIELFWFLQGIYSAFWQIHGRNPDHRAKKERRHKDPLL